VSIDVILMRQRTVQAFAPATIANLGPGFDTLGLAIHHPGDVVVATRRVEQGLTFSVQTKYENVPLDAGRNVAAYVAQVFLEEAKPPFGVAMVLHKKMPISSGIGSSAASSVAAVVAVNALLSKPLPKKDLLRFAIEGERFASGSPHADNIAPGLLGGVQLVRSLDPLDVIAVPARNIFTWVVVHPHIKLPTSEARKVLPRAVELSRAVRHWGNVGGLIIGLVKGDARLVRASTEDVIVEPIRARLVPGFYEVKHAALKAGALGCSMSGSGPSLFAVTSSGTDARRVASNMRKVFAAVAGVGCDVFISKVNMRGATIMAVGSG
jgi:homoserine kinase